MRPGQKIKNTGFQLAGSKGWSNEKMSGKWTPKGGQEMIDDSLSYDEEISEEEIEPPEDEEEDVDEVPPSPVGRGGKLWMSMYNVLYLRASTYELDAYKGRGTPQPTKHTRAIHEKYCQLIDRHMRKSTDSSTTKSPKVPEPKAYNSKEDAEKFEGWLKNLLRWYHINRYCGMEHDEDRISCMALFLQGDALCWYDNNVDGTH